MRIVRDRWGVPHIYAETQDDLFVAQGFVQAQDRLFQMDLWRRASQGRLSEVLGPNFVERDAMTRRVQYRGDLDAEWTAYGPDARTIAGAFVRGVNAWIEIVRASPPELFVLAGWEPESWSAADLLNRTDAFVASGDALDEASRAGLSEVVRDAIRRAGAPPFFATLARPLSDVHSSSPRARGDTPSDSRNDAGTRDRELLSPLAFRPNATGRVVATRGRSLEVAESGRQFDHPSTRYLVHLHAPGWNVIGVAAPWLPGVAVGHNDRIAWGMAPLDADTQDVYADRADPSGSSLFKDAIVIKGRKEPFVFDSEITRHGVVVAVDTQQRVRFTLRWSGTERGAAGGLAAVVLDRARSWSELRTALAAWKMPARRVVYADVDGNAGFQDAALVPVRRGREWAGWRTIDDLPHALNPPGDSVRAEDTRRSAAPRATGGAVFSHPLAVTRDARRRFDIGPLARPADDRPLQMVFDLEDWDRSRAINAPGQSESADSAHFADLAAMWSRGERFPLAFSDAAVAASAASTLVLMPRR